MSQRFKNVDINSVTVENCKELLPATVYGQLKQFLPPEGSFDTDVLKRYLLNVKNYEEEDDNLEMTLANKLRLSFKNMKPGTICDKFPQVELNLKRRLRCVAEYLIRSGEFDKLKDENGKLIKKKGILGKMVVIYKPLPKMLEALKKQKLI